MGRRESTARTRYLGARLREYREQANWQQSSLAQQLQVAHPTLCRVETGARGMTATTLITYLTLCGVVGSEQAQMLELAQRRVDERWVCPHEDRPPDDLPALLQQLHQANRITCYHPSFLPSLLQTRNTTFAYRHQEATVRSETAIAATRLEWRQEELFQRQDKQFEFFVPGSVLRALPGDAEVVSEQMIRLGTLMADPDKLVIRIIPAEHEHCAGMGRFWLFGFPKFPPVVCIQGDALSVFAEDDADIAAYERVVERLSRLALSPEASRDLIALMS
jgi:transcriptional regulator with XRE-family HTH domain